MKLLHHFILLLLITISLIFPFQISNAKENIEETLGKINKTNLPLSVKIIPVENATLNTSSELQPLAVSPSQTPEDVSVLNPNTAGQYSIAASGKTPESTPTNLANFFARLIASIKDFFDFGNKKAKKYAGTQLPKEAVEKTLSQSSPETNLAFHQNTDQQILGIFDTSAMAKALPLLQCANLPFGIGNCPQGNNPFASPAPSGVIPTGTYPTSGPAPTGGTIGEINGCPFGTGYCSVEYLAKNQFFGNIDNAQKASAICQRESGSNPFAANKKCLENTSVDYSIGLFQINLLAHCASSAFSYTWSPPSCKILDQSLVDSCEQKMLDPDQNITEAVNIYNSGGWGAWSAAGPEYCNIK